VQLPYGSTCITCSGSDGDAPASAKRGLSGVVAVARAFPFFATPSVRALALAAVVAAAPGLTLAQGVKTAPNEDVARTFIAATQAQDRQAALLLLDKKVSIQFPGHAAEDGQGQGQPFVIGYLDGLFYGERGVSLDGGGDAQAGAVRFTAHDASQHDRYVIEVEVKNSRVVRVKVNLEPHAPAPQAVALLNPS